MFEHYTDGDVFDCSMQPGWAPMSVSGLAQWGPKATAEFTGARTPASCSRRSKPDRQGQRDRLRRPARPDQGDVVMSVNLARTAEGWWVQAPAGMVRLDLPAASTGELLADRAALEAAVQAALAAPDHARPPESLSLLSPVTAPARVVAQMVNYRSHANDSGMDPDRVPRRSSARPRTRSPAPPATSSARPGSASWTTRSSSAWSSAGSCRSAPPSPTPTCPGTSPRWWSPTTSAPGRSSDPHPVLRGEVLPHLHPGRPVADPGRRRRPQPAGDAAADPVGQRAGAPGQHRRRHDRAPGAGLTLLSRFQPLAAGDLLLTGTPGGTALTAPPKLAEKLAALLPPATRWKLFFRRQAGNPRYLHDGDLITATIATADRALDLGTQRTRVIGKAS